MKGDCCYLYRVNTMTMSRVDMEMVPLKHPRIMQIKTCQPTYLFCIALSSGHPVHPAAAPICISLPAREITVTASHRNAEKEPLASVGPGAVV